MNTFGKYNYLPQQAIDFFKPIKMMGMVNLLCQHPVCLGNDVECEDPSELAAICTFVCFGHIFGVVVLSLVSLSSSFFLRGEREREIVCDGE